MARWRRWIAALVVALLVVVAAGGAWWWWSGEERARDRAAEAAVAAYTAALGRRDVSRVRFADPSLPSRVRATFAGMPGATVRAQPGPVERSGDTATSTVLFQWTLPGRIRWTYAVPTPLVERGGAWLVASPRSGSIVHRHLAPTERMTLTRLPAARGDLLDRGGAALMPVGSVYPVQLDPTRADRATAARLEAVVDAQPGSVVRRLEAARRTGSKAPIPVITYREADFGKQRDPLDALEGVIYPRTEQPLGPTRDFGQPLLGGFGEVTAEVVERSDGRYVAGDRAGLSGLQGQYDGLLAGAPGARVAGGSSGTVLFRESPRDGQDVRTTLSPPVQRAAESALRATKNEPAALVALDVPTGEVLAVANTPPDGFDRAVGGRYAPGSAFKVATTYALLSRQLVTPQTRLPCPPQVVVDGKRFVNYEGSSLPDPTFRTDFAQSCNTAFVRAASRLGAEDLTRAAKALGVGARWDGAIGVDGAFVGSVPTASGDVDRAAAALGQGKVEASPLALAVMAGSVARGSYVPPVLVHQDGTPAPAPAGLDAKVIAQLQDLMASVVAEGTATVLRGTAGGQVRGKTGTAEFGAEIPPQTRAWFVGYQGRTAFAVLVEEGESGGGVAAPVAERFLEALAR